MSLLIQVDADVQVASRQIQDFSKQSRIALNSLSLVAQDLPFGFIGIQNNLPGVIQSFGALRAETGSVAGALKELGKGLVGPAGIFLAFSAVTSAITFAIQKYGSLGAAIDAIFSKINPLSKVLKDAAKSQEDFNSSFKTTGQIVAAATGSVESQILKVGLLSKTVLDLSKSEDSRKSALSELQKIDKAYFGQITTGTEDVAKLEAATKKYTESILANAIAKSYEEKFTQGAVNLETQKNLLKELANSYENVAKERKKFAQEIEGTFDPLTGAKITAPVITGGKELDAFNKQKLVVDEAIKQQDLLKQSFESATLEALNFVKPVIDGKEAVKDYKYEISDLKNMFSFKTEIDNIKELADIILDVNKKYSERSTSLKELQKLGDGVFNSLNLEKSGYNNIKDAIDLYIRKLQMLDIQQQSRLKASKLQEQADANEAKAKDALIKKEQDLFDAIEKNFYANDQFKNKTDQIGAAAMAKVTLPLKDIQDGAKKAAILIDEVFFNPLNEMFNTFLTKGTFSIKEFTKSLLSSIAQIASKLLATGIVSTLISLFSMPFGGALSSGGALGFIGDAIGSMNTRKPNFNGVENRGTDINGQVNLVLRGSDLVGSINRTNAQISRTG